MSRLKSLFVILVALGLAACSQSKAPFASTMNRDTVSFAQTEEEQALHRQAQALDRMSRDLVRKTTMKGAAIGAVAGCGLVVVGGSKANCAKAALVGGVIGGVAGNAAGKAEVEKRVEMVELNRVLPSLRQTRDQMALVKEGISGVMALQDAEIAAMKQQLADGSLSQAAYDARIDDIRTNRSELAQSLSMSARQAKEARESLQAAKAEGQTGIDWYISETQRIEDEAVSARAQVTLL